ncbi:hypothetical protein GCM10009559_06090 [Pseudonocardia zijingensis]|uniref:Transposase IS110-like N-terminal domain-containing protein n=1 Tax=Pseudonocardia zijingensis TaxID=153376 RepID=A0ABP3ZJF8_9PSEU
MAGKKLWVGIDVGKQFHHGCAVDADGKTVFSRKVKNRQAAIEELITRTTIKAGAGADGGEVVWALDMTSGSAALLVALLVSTGQPVRSVPGRLVNRMSGAFTGEGKNRRQGCTHHRRDRPAARRSGPGHRARPARG